MSKGTVINNNISFQSEVKVHKQKKGRTPSLRALGDLTVETGEAPIADGSNHGAELSQDTKDYLFLFASMPIDGYVVLPKQYKSKVSGVAVKYFKGRYSVINHENGEDIIFRKNKE